MENANYNYLNETMGNSTAFGLPVVEGVDWNVAVKNTGNESILKDVLIDICKSSNSEVEYIKKVYQEYFESSDDAKLELYRVKVHALKNTAAVIGATEISEQFKTLEYAARDKELTVIKQNTDKTCSAYLSLAMRISKAFEIDMKNKSEVSSELIISILGKLKCAMDDFDIETLNDTMDMLENMSWNVEAKAQIDRLSDAVLQLDSDLLCDAADELEKMYV